MAGIHKSATGASSTSIKIDNAQNVYVADTININNLFVGSHKPCEDCGVDLENKLQVTRWTQATWFGQPAWTSGDQLHCNNCIQVDLYVNKAALEGMAVEDIRKAQSNIQKCFARFFWNGQEIYAPALQAWTVSIREELKEDLKEDLKKKLKEEMKVLLKRGVKENMQCLQTSITNAISKESNRSTLCQTVKKLCEEHESRMIGIDAGSLVFILQHSSEKDAEQAKRNPEAIQKILLGLLPEWVREEHLKWKIQRCQPSPNQEPGCELSQPIPLFCQRSQNGAYMDHRYVERLWQIESFKEDIKKGMKEELKEELKEIIRASMSSFFKQHPEAVVSVGPQEQSQQEKDSTSASPVLESSTAREDNDTSSELVPGGAHIDVKTVHSGRTAQSETFDPSANHYGITNAKLDLPGQTLKASDSGVNQYDVGRMEKLSKLSSNIALDPGNRALQKGAQSEKFPQPMCATAATALAPQLNPSTDKMYQIDAKGGKQEQLKHEFHQHQGRLDGKGDSSAYFSADIMPDERPDEHIKVLAKADNMPRQKTITHSSPPSDMDSGLAHSSEREESPGRERHKPVGEPSDQPKSQASQKQSEESRTIQAEQLLNWVNVKSKASQSSDPEIQRMMDQVKHALEDEEPQSPRARALDTVLVMDTSESVVSDSLDQLKTVVHTFVDGIEENVETMNLEENLAVVQIAGRAWVRQHLTNDYNRIRDAIEEMTPDSKIMPTGGRTPLFQALLVCLGAIEGRGGVVNVAGCHRVRPRLIFFTDGRPTDEATESGPDVQSNVNEVKFALVQLISEFASKKHKTTPAPIFWVPVGQNPDLPFLESLAALSGGKVVKMENIEELCRYYKVQETIGCVYKMVRKHTDVYDTEQQTMTVINALAGNLSETEKKYIAEEVNKKKKDPENETGDADDFDNVYEDTEYVEAETLLPLGTRVRRGRDWKWNNQDTDGAGTVIQHRKKRDGWLHVMWDNGTHNAYRFGDGECYDVQQVDEPRLLGGSELIEIGVTVVRGEDWKSGEEDGHGKGVVIRKRKDGKVKVRWENGYIGKYRFGADGKMELKVDQEFMMSFPRQPVPGPTAEEEEQGAVGGFDPHEGQSIRIWQWKDQRTNEWRLYDERAQEKLQKEYKKRKDGSCVIERDGRSRRVLFRTNQEKTVDRGGGMLPVRILMVGEEEYSKLQKEEKR